MKRFLLVGMLICFLFKHSRQHLFQRSASFNLVTIGHLREEVMLNCRADGAWFVINPATLMQYPLNEIANETDGKWKSKSTVN